MLCSGLHQAPGTSAEDSPDVPQQPSGGCSYMSPSSACFLLAGTLGTSPSTGKLTGVSSAGSRLQSYDSYNPLQLPSQLYNYTLLTCHTPPLTCLYRVCSNSITMPICKKNFTHFLKAKLAKWCKLVLGHLGQCWC